MTTPLGNPTLNTDSSDALDNDQSVDLLAEAERMAWTALSQMRSNEPLQDSEARASERLRGADNSQSTRTVNNGDSSNYKTKRRNAPKPNPGRRQLPSTAPNKYREENAAAIAMARLHMQTCQPKWFKTFCAVEQHVASFQQEPSKRNNKKLAEFLKGQRKSAFKQGAQFTATGKHKITLFNAIGINILSLKPTPGKRDPWKGEYVPRWVELAAGKHKFDIEHNVVTDQKHQKGRMDLNNLLLNFVKGGWNVLEEYRFIAAYVVKCLRVGDVDPSSCTRDKSTNDIRGVLSYISHPIQHNPKNWIAPSDIVPNGRSTYFACEKLPLELRELLECFVTTLPDWFVKMFRKEVRYSKQELVQLVSAEKKWFDNYMISRCGTNSKGGYGRITETTNSGPRRLALSVSIHPPEYDAKHRAHLQDLYGYSYSFIPMSWMGCRSMKDYELISEIGFQAWKATWDSLDPVSQQVPPTACSALTYFGDLGCRMNPHQDNSPSMQFSDVNDNSQILGSSAMVVSLFDTQRFVLTSVEGSKIKHEFHTEHMSIYILSAFDDINWKHLTTFTHTGGQQGKIRMALVYRWLGRRTRAFCSDYQGDRKHMEYWMNPNTEVHRKFPNDKRAQEGFKHKKQDFRKKAK